ncbi:hypothetical protein C2845_PM01G45030 [Panicum miliaceum]|uniref:Uncharacterized protein n=1 Tax=Panicum miliaceum TaxID=4540 RepID=A0A3L6TLM8_PANMI|nr:hypothetical protein C2845_PM01G45030 [Panicum miliaceum]
MLELEEGRDAAAREARLEDATHEQESGLGQSSQGCPPPPPPPPSPHNIDSKPCHYI